MHWLKTSFEIAVITILFKQASLYHNNIQKIRRAPMRFIDYGEWNNDLYFDRVVPINLRVDWPDSDKHRLLLSLGVFITSNQILTSYNPYRLFIHNKTMLDKIFVFPLTSRKRFPALDPGAVGKYVYWYTVLNIECGRQVIPDEEYTMRHCHGKNGFDCPVHDLMVLRISESVSFTDLPIATFSQFPHTGSGRVSIGFRRTEIAKPNDTLSDYIKFASAGFKDKFHVRNNFELRKVEYNPEQSAVVDCDRWLPREWGHFICVRNLGDYPALGSSALLISDEKVFGMGGFAFFRGKEGIFAFTDVRPYYDLIMNTCSHDDDEG